MPIRSLNRLSRSENEAVIRNLCQVAYLGDHTALCRVLGRYKMYVDTRDIGLAAHLMLDGYWEIWNTYALLDLVPPGGVVADIGANLGYFTLLFAELVGATGKVHAFEPNPSMARLLTKSVYVNGFWNNTTVHQVALDDGSESLRTLMVPPHDPKNASMVPTYGTLSDERVEVPSARLDSQVDWQNIEFAKIDVEGAEQLVWAGMQGLLDNGRLKTVVLEFTADRYGDPLTFLRELQAPGFTLARVDFVDGVVETTEAEILAGAANVDVMLVLRR